MDKLDADNVNNVGDNLSNLKSKVDKLDNSEKWYCWKRCI